MSLSTPTVPPPSESRTLIRPRLKPILRGLAMTTHRAVARGRGRSLRLALIQCPMRSGSSLLSQLLNSQPGFHGLGEANINYTTGGGLPELYAATVWELRRPILLPGYVVDKVVHDRLLDAQACRRLNAKSIFLLRDPVDCMESLVEKISHGDQERAIVYFEQRLQTLVRNAAAGDPRHQVVMTYEQLKNQTAEVFDLLASVLGVQGFTTEQYTPHRLTGRWGVGDGGERIGAGRILRDRPTHTAALEPEIRARAIEADRRCRAELYEHGRFLPGFETVRRVAPPIDTVTEP